MSQGTFPGFGPGISSRFAGFLSNPLLEQIFVWQVLQQLTSAILAPEMAGLSEEVFKLNPSLQLSVADAVEAVIKGHMTYKEGQDEARLSGINEPRFDRLLETAGDPPGPATLLELWRRKVIPESGTGAESVSVEQGIREGRTKNKWIEPLKVLKTSLPSPEAALQALLEGQTDKATALDLYEQWGGDPRYFDLMFETRGSAPTPLEAAQMANRGIIPWSGQGPDVVSFEQAFLEGPWRNKWLEPMHALSVYMPPPRTITALIHAGVISEERAHELFRQAGLSEEMAAIYVKAAHKEKHAATRDLTKSEIIALYEAQAITREAATKRILAQGYSAEGAELELELADLKVNRTLLTHATTRVGSLYVGRRIDKTHAATSLDALKIPAAQRDRLLQVWTLERGDNLKHLTPAEIGHAVKEGWFSVEEGLDELGKLGYGPRDAWVSLSIHLKGPATAAMPADNVPPS